MLYPSVDKLMDKMNSKYTLVTVAAKRARLMQINEDQKIEKTVSHKSVGKALEEIDKGLLSYRSLLDDNTKSE